MNLKHADLFLKYNLFSLFWMLTIVVLSLLPGSDLPKVEIVQIDKLVHFVFYFLLFSFTAYGWKKQSQFLFLKTAPWAVIWLVCILFGVGIELGQEFLTADRHFEWLDIFSNTSGAFVAMIAWKLHLKKIFLQ